eukprot:661007-Amorphochlora_amoeboformis.AAC.1
MGSQPQQMGSQPQQMGSQPQQMGTQPQQMGSQPQQVTQQMGGQYGTEVKNGTTPMKNGSGGVGEYRVDTADGKAYTL